MPVFNPHVLTGAAAEVRIEHGKNDPVASIYPQIKKETICENLRNLVCQAAPGQFGNLKGDCHVTS